MKNNQAHEPIRDYQRAKLYAWESVASGFKNQTLSFQTIEQCADFVRKVWRSDAANFGLNLYNSPLVSQARFNQRHAYAILGHGISLPEWAMNEWTILHEVAHHFCDAFDSGHLHDADFVGCLIGLLSRHAGYCALDLIASANASGLDVSTRLMGYVRRQSPAKRLKQALAEHKQFHADELTSHLGLSSNAMCNLLISRIVRGDVVCRQGYVKKAKARPS